MRAEEAKWIAENSLEFRRETDLIFEGILRKCANGDFEYEHENVNGTSLILFFESLGYTAHLQGTGIKIGWGNLRYGLNMKFELRKPNF